MSRAKVLLHSRARHFFPRGASFPVHRRLSLLIALALFASGPASATDFVVTSSADSVSDNYGDTTDTTTLRYALIQANAAGGTNTITFSPDVIGPIVLAGALPFIFNHLTIDGSGAQNGRVTIDGGSTAPYFPANSARRIFFVGIDEATRTNVIVPNFSTSPLASRLAVTLKNLTLQNGVALGGAGLGQSSGGGGMGAGGALFVNGAADVILDEVSFSNNQAMGGGFDGGPGTGGGGLAGTGGGGGGGAGRSVPQQPGRSNVGGYFGGAGLFGAGGNYSGGGGGYTGDGCCVPTIGENSAVAGTRSLAGISGAGGNGYADFVSPVPPPSLGGANGGGGANYSGGGGFRGGNGYWFTDSVIAGAGAFGGGGGLGGGLGGAGGFGGGGGLGSGGPDNSGCAPNCTYHDGVGGPGGFGGGGGLGKCSPYTAAGNSDLAFGGAGGFGGGGGAAIAECFAGPGVGGAGGHGGFGGGGGGGVGRYMAPSSSITPGVGGFAASDAVPATNPFNPFYFCGGGGAALGGAIFVVDGGTLTVQGVGIESHSNVVGGASNSADNCDPGAGAGQGFGSALFLQGSSGSLSFNLPTGQYYTLTGAIADEAGASSAGAQNPGASPGKRSISLDGPGTVVLNGASTFGGTMSINAGILAGNGQIGPVTLAGNAQIAPGDPAIAGGIGTLGMGPLTWNAGGAMAFQLGNTQAESDLLLVNGSLGKAGAGTFTFHFGMSDKPPLAGATYILIQSFNASAFSASDFNFDTDSTYQNLSGSFSIVGHDVQFTVETVQSDRIFANGFD